MNRQPFCKPPRWWEPKLTPWWIRLSRGHRLRQLRHKQGLAEIESQNIDRLHQEVAAGKGVLIAPNHSAHYDSAALYVAADRINQPLYFMAAWQVFGMSNAFERWAMQRLGCFSVDRESADRQAFKQAVHILQSEPHPLVIFPEGDIYHTTDHVTPFREGAAAIALSAAKRSEREIVVIPCGIKFWYVDDPTKHLLAAMRTIEDRLYLRPAPEMSLRDRVHRLAEGALALKELDYLNCTRSGSLRERVMYLTNAVLSELEQRHDITHADGTPPERIKALRQCVIQKLNEAETAARSDDRPQRRLEMDMEDLFFATQLFSYRGDYLSDQPSIERLAETIDKFEEDILQRDLPSVRGRRRVLIRFGEPIEVHSQRGRNATVELNAAMQNAVQTLIDGINATAAPA